MFHFSPGPLVRHGGFVKTGEGIFYGIGGKIERTGRERDTFKLDSWVLEMDLNSLTYSFKEQDMIVNSSLVAAEVITNPGKGREVKKTILRLFDQGTYVFVFNFCFFLILQDNNCLK